MPGSGGSCPAALVGAISAQPLSHPNERSSNTSGAAGPIAVGISHA